MSSLIANMQLAGLLQPFPTPTGQPINYYESMFPVTKKTYLDVVEIRTRPIQMLSDGHN